MSKSSLKHKAYKGIKGFYLIVYGIFHRGYSSHQHQKNHQRVCIELELELVVLMSITQILLPPTAAERLIELNIVLNFCEPGLI